MDDKQKLSDFLLMKLQECKLKPHDATIESEDGEEVVIELSNGLKLRVNKEELR